jgi:hypothetical protein
MPSPDELLQAHLQDAHCLETFEALKRTHPFAAASYVQQHGSAIYRAAALRGDGGESHGPTRPVHPRHTAASLRFLK